MYISEPRLVALKIAYNGEIHRIRINLSDFHYAQLYDLFKTTFQIQDNENIIIQYKDNEGDSVAIQNEEEYIEAVKSYLLKKSTNSNTGCLRFHMIMNKPDSTQFQEQIAKPLVQALEKLIEQLQNTVVLLKNQDWKNKYDKSVETADQLLHNAKVTMKNAKQNIHENIKDTPFEQIIKDTGDGLKAAVDGINGFAKDLIEEVKNMQHSNQNQTQTTSENDTVENDTNVDIASQEGHIMLENDDWQKVVQYTASSSQEQSSASEVSETPAVIVEQSEAVAIDDATPNVETVAEAPAETPLHPDVANGVNLICEVFPACGKQTALRLLAEANNNVEVVLNRLAEEGY